ncbi:resolvase D domain protein, partial [Escherichia coli FRIK523]
MVPAVYSAGQPASLPVAIDYPAALALRQMSMVHDELNRPGFPGECFICELRLPDHRFRWKHN